METSALCIELIWKSVYTWSFFPINEEWFFYCKFIFIPVTLNLFSLLRFPKCRPHLELFFTLWEVGYLVNSINIGLIWYLTMYIDFPTRGLPRDALCSWERLLFDVHLYLALLFSLFTHALVGKERFEMLLL